MGRERHRQVLLIVSIVASLGLLFANNISAAQPKRVLVVNSFGSAAPPFSVHAAAFESGGMDAERRGRASKRIDHQDALGLRRRYVIREEQSEGRNDRDDQQSLSVTFTAHSADRLSKHSLKPSQIGWLQASRLDSPVYADNASIGTPSHWAASARSSKTGTSRGQWA